MVNIKVELPVVSAHESRLVSKSFSMLGFGYYVESKFIRKLFGCDGCPFIGTETCPHGIGKGERHVNGICSFRMGQLKELYDAAGSVPRLFQQDAIVKSQIILEDLREKYALTGKLHPSYHQLEKNMIGLLDKVRKQDEGIKISGDLNVTHDRLREIIEAQAVHVVEAEVATINKQRTKDGRVPSIWKDHKLEDASG